MQKLFRDVETKKVNYRKYAFLWNDEKPVAI